MRLECLLLYFFICLWFGLLLLLVENQSLVKGNVVRTNVYHKYIKDFKLNITIDLDGFIYYPLS